MIAEQAGKYWSIAQDRLKDVDLGPVYQYWSALRDWLAEVPEMARTVLPESMSAYFLAKTPELTPEQEERLIAFIKNNVGIPYTHEQHYDELVQLWKDSFPDSDHTPGHSDRFVQNALCIMITNAAFSVALCGSNKAPAEAILLLSASLCLLRREWKRLGFQGENPATDFRAAGVLPVRCLCHFAEVETLRNLPSLPCTFFSRCSCSHPLCTDVSGAVSGDPEALRRHVRGGQLPLRLRGHQHHPPPHRRHEAQEPQRTPQQRPCRCPHARHVHSLPPPCLLPPLSRFAASTSAPCPIFEIQATWWGGQRMLLRAQCWGGSRFGLMLEKDENAFKEIFCIVPPSRPALFPPPSSLLPSRWSSFLPLFLIPLPFLLLLLLPACPPSSFSLPPPRPSSSSLLPPRFPSSCVRPASMPPHHFLLSPSITLLLPPSLLPPSLLPPLPSPSSLAVTMMLTPRLRVRAGRRSLRWTRSGCARTPRT
jgi:hypothetical protein